MWCCWCDSYNMKMETPPLWYVLLNIYHSLYTKYEPVLLLTVPLLLWYSDSLWAAQTGEQWAPKENGRRSSHQESRLGTSKVIYSSLFFSSSIVRLKHHQIRAYCKRVLYNDPCCLFIWAALTYSMWNNSSSLLEVPLTVLQHQCWQPSILLHFGESRSAAFSFSQPVL